MKSYRSFREIIKKWPSAREFGEAIGAKEVTARQMRTRNSISSEHWNRVIAAATAKGLEGVTLELLAELAEHGGNLPAEEGEDASEPAGALRTGTHG